MAAILQLRPGVPIARQRFSSFASKYDGKAPDFMRGVLTVTLYGAGNLKIAPNVSGDVTIRCSRLGKIEVN